MKSKKVIFTILLLVFVACIVLGYKIFFPASEKTPQITEVRTEKTRQAIDMQPTKKIATIPPANEIQYTKLIRISNEGDSQKAVKEAFNSPINFWGKVVDENNNPIPQATVTFALADKAWQSPTKQTSQSNAEGKFSITGAKGGGLSVRVAREGYYSTPESSYSQAYFYQGKEGVTYSTPENPVILRLRKKGEGVKLVQINTKIELPKSGNAVGINLATGGRETPHISIQQQSTERDASGKFDWTAKISVPNGGLLERNDPYSFTAPASGYRQTADIQMAKNAPQWINTADQEYFVKTGDGKYARLTIRFVPAGGYARIVSFLNPTGSNNLELAAGK